MDKRFLMGQDDVLTRIEAKAQQPTTANNRLMRSLRAAAIEQAVGFYREFFGADAPPADAGSLAEAYGQALAQARSLGLFAPGGIREKDHLNFWCLGQVMRPQTYIESGVYIGSSLHAFLGSPGLDRVIAIDPNLTQLKIPTAEIPGAVLMDDRDFSELDLTFSPDRSLAYFDDHINTAQRILQAHHKGLRYLMFDDSTGIEGMTQRLYPAVPTVPMVMQPELFAPGDQIEWTFQCPAQAPKRTGLLGISRGGGGVENIRVTLRVTTSLLDQCRQAGGLVRRWRRVPDLGQWIPQTSPEKMVDTSKYLVELK